MVSAASMTAENKKVFTQQWLLTQVAAMLQASGFVATPPPQVAVKPSGTFSPDTPRGDTMVTEEVAQYECE